MLGHPVLAAFVWPALFYGGAGAIGAPVLIHFLARRRFRRIRWAATHFLLQAVRRNKRRVWLEDLILMLMRCLAVLLIALLVARPFFRPSGLAGLIGGAERTERIFVIDDSYSMAYRRPDGAVAPGMMRRRGEPGDDVTERAGSCFSRAKQAVVRLIELLIEQSPNDTVTVLRASQMHSPVSAGVYLDERQTQELFARVQGLHVSQRTLSPREMFQAVRRMLDNQPDTVSAAVYVVSDFQRADWVASGARAATPASSRGTPARARGTPAKPAASMIAPLTGWRDDRRGLKLVLVDVGDDEADNVAVTGLESVRGRLVAGVRTTITATVANYSDVAAESLDLEVAVGPAVQPPVAITGVPQRDTTQVPIPVTADRPGWQQIRVSVPEDGLTVDNARTLVVEAVDAVRILVVNGEPSSDPYRDEVTLLTTALRPPGEVYSGNALRVIDETELDDASFDDIDVIVLANVFRISESAAESLSAFTRAGGGVAVFLGDQVDADRYNAALYDEGRGLLPARLDEPRSAPPAGARLVADAPRHPMVRIFTGADNPFVKHITFRRYFACTLPATDEETATERRPELIAHFSDAAGTPAVVERTFGAGRVTLLTSSCDLEWNDWAKDPSYVVALLELAHYLARGRGASADLLVGSPIDLPVDLGQYEPDVRLRTPGYPAEQEMELTAAPGQDGRGFAVRWERTDEAGVYRFFLSRRDGTQDVRAVAVNPDPKESDLAPATEADLRQALPEMPFTYVDGLRSLDAVGQDARREFWKVALLAAIVVLMAEQLLGWWFGRRS